MRFEELAPIQQRVAHGMLIPAYLDAVMHFSAPQQQTDNIAISTYGGF
jgi:hypothetical protein